MKILLTAALAAFAAAAVSAQVDPNRIIAVVNGEEIKGDEYYHRMEFLPGVGQMAGQQFEEAPPGFLTVQRLINERLIFQAAKKQGVFPTDAEVDAEYQARVHDSPNMEQQWVATGQSLPELKYRVKLDLTQFKLETNGITITDKEVSDFYAANPTQFTMPKSYKLRVIAVQSDADKTAVNAALASGTSFADAAKRFSAEASKSLGGEMGWRYDSTLPPQVQGVLNTTKIGTASDWVQSPQASYKFLVEDIKPPSKLPLDDSLRRNLRRKLMKDRGDVKNNIAKLMHETIADAKVDIKDPVLADAFQKFIKAYLSQGG